MELTLNLKGLMQSYGEDEPWTANRRTNTKPTETAVKGIVECAFGLSRIGVDADGDDMIRKDIWEHVDVIIHTPDKLPHIIVDDQIVRELVEGMRFKNAEGNNMSNGMPRIKKEYIAGGEFKVTLKGTDEYIEKIRYRLLHPVYPYCLGRACCIPSAPLIQEEK